MVKVEGDNWWLGLHTYENDGRFHWSDHSVLNYVSWALGRPHPLSRDRKCVHFSAAKGKNCQNKKPQGTKIQMQYTYLSLYLSPPNSGLGRSEVPLRPALHL